MAIARKTSSGFSHRWLYYVLALLLSFESASAQTMVTADRSGTSGTKRIRSTFDMFSRKVNVQGGIFEVKTIHNDEAKETFVATPPPEAPVPAKTAEQKLEEHLRYYNSENPESEPITDPSETPSVRVMPDAPSPIKGMIGAYRSGNQELAENFADQFVRLQKNFFFEVKQITKLIGEALVRQDVINGDDWLGAEQMLDIEMAKSRDEMGALMRPDHDTAMKQIKPDSRGKAQVYYFFNMSCSWCRKMAPDVERLWRLVKDDENITLNVLTIGAVPNAWLDEYKAHTGLSMPIFDGTAVAKQFNLGFVPAILIIAPSDNKAYVKTGQQSFIRMYQFVRTVQGLPATADKRIEQLATTPIGEVEAVLAGNNPKPKPALQRASLSRPEPIRVEVEKF